jgi:hypothetical protein
VSTALAEELKGLRRGRGVHQRAIEDRVGPELARVCGIAPGTERSAVRAAVIEKLGQAVATLPAELSLSASAALGIAPATADLLQLQDRVEWLATQLKRDVRTARRRVDEACGRLAEVLGAGTSAVSSGRRGVGWYVAEFHAAALLGGPASTTVERRVVVAERDGLDRIQLGWSLRTPATGPGSDLGIRVLYGGTLDAPEETAGSRMRITLRLPRPLRATERHEYSVMTTLPPGRAMQKHYVYTPSTRCDRFVLRAHFEPELIPARLWQVLDVFHRDLDERTVEGAELVPDRCGDVRVDFDDMLPGHGYGIQWD